MLQVVSLTVFALLLARVMRAPRGTWRWIVGAAALVLAASQLLPAGNAFREDVAGSATALFWIGLALVPVAGYALLIRAIRRRTVPAEGRGPAPRPTGLVLIAEDGALARDTETALAAEAGAAPDERLSVGWRNGAGEMVGHARLRLARGVADLELLWVAEAERGRGIGARLVAQAGAEARARGARDLMATASTATAAAFLERQGFAACGAAPLTGGGERRHFHKALG